MPTAFDPVAASYDCAIARVSAPFVPTLLAACRLARGDRLLDVGTGTGLVAAAAAADHAASVVGLEAGKACFRSSGRWARFAAMDARPLAPLARWEARFFGVRR